MRTFLLLATLALAVWTAPAAAAEDCAKAPGGVAVCLDWRFAEACVTVKWGILPLADKTHCNPVPAPMP